MAATIRLRVWEIVPVLLVEVILHDLGVGSLFGGSRGSHGALLPLALTPIPRFVAALERGNHDQIRPPRANQVRWHVLH